MRRQKAALGAMLEFPRVLHKEVQQECSEGRAASLRFL